MKTHKMHIIIHKIRHKEVQTIKQHNLAFLLLLRCCAVVSGKTRTLEKLGEFHKLHNDSWQRHLVLVL